MSDGPEPPGFVRGARAAIVVPSYAKSHAIDGPYFGDLVYAHLQREHPGEFDLVHVEVRSSNDGSEENFIAGNVRGRACYVVHPVHVNPAQHLAIMEQVADNLLRSDAFPQDLVLIEPYNPYGSYDQRKGKQPLTARIVGDKCRAAGYTRVFTIEPHSRQLGLAYDRHCSLEPLPVAAPLAQHFRQNCGLSNLENLTVCSVDVGGYGRAETYANLLGTPLVGLRKRRATSQQDKTEIVGLIGRPEEVEGRYILFPDDVIRTAGSMVHATEFVMKLGALGTFLLAPHLSLFKQGRERIAACADIRKVFGTNSCPNVSDGAEDGKYSVMDGSGIIADVIYKRTRGESLSEFFRTFQNGNGHGASAT